MSDFNSDMLELLEVFSVEANENVQHLTSDLLKLEKIKDKGEINNILESMLRVAHSLKGGARVSGISSLEQIIHTFESVCQETKNGKIELSTDLINVFLQSVDFIEPSIVNAMTPDAEELDPSNILNTLNNYLEGKVGTKKKTGKAKSEKTAKTKTIKKAVKKPKKKKKEKVVEHTDEDIDVNAMMTELAKQEMEKQSLTSEVDNQEEFEDEFDEDEQDYDEEADRYQLEENKQSKVKSSSKEKDVKVRSKAAEDTVRVSTAKLEKLMNQVGELLVSKLKSERLMNNVARVRSDLDELSTYNQQLNVMLKRFMKNSGSKKFSKLEQRLMEQIKSMSQIVMQVDNIHKNFYQDNLRSSMIIDELQDDVRELRMLPVSTILPPIERAVRDLTQELNKNVNLKIIGKETRIDKSILEGIKDPLMHLIRNSMDHGIELPSERAKKNKPESATIQIETKQFGSSLIIKVMDDGKGLDLDKIRKNAVKNRIITDEDAYNLSNKAIMSLIFRSGFSTTDKVTDISGRGVGLDVVGESIERLQGTYEVSSKKDKGTEFTLNLPLSVTTLHGILIKLGLDTYIIPVNAIDRIARVPVSDIVKMANTEAVRVDGIPISLVSLAKVLQKPEMSMSKNQNENITVLVLGRGETKIAFYVDDVISEEEVVLKGLGNQLKRVKNVAGGTIMGDGKPVIILNPSDMMRAATFSRNDVTFRFINDDLDTEAKKRILVVDDSITTRAFEQNILLSGGYDVEVAFDGVDAVNKLQSNKYNLIVSDIQMPNMDGLELTSWVKKNDITQDLPIILVSAKETDEDKQMGLEMGADAYIGKSECNAGTLLDVVKQFI